MLNKDAFSILIPFYNTSALTQVLLNALCKQREKYPQTQIVVVDDASTEDTAWIAKIPGITFDRLESVNGKPPGEAAARNRCLDLADCEWVAWIDSDDMIVPDYLDILYENARKGFDYVVYSWQDRHGVRGDWHKEDILWNWNVWSYTYRRELLTERFDERRNGFSDFPWLKDTIKPGWSRLVVDTPIIIYNGDREDSLSKQIARGEISLWKE